MTARATIRTDLASQPKKHFADKRVTVDVNRLKIGQTIQFPIFDEQAILLLAEGSVITQDFKRYLQARDILVVAVHSEDAAHIVTDEPDHSESVGIPAQLSPSTIEPMEAVDFPSVRNVGPAVRERRVLHGAVEYDADQHKALIAKHTAIDGSLNQMMHNVLNGVSVDARAVEEIVTDMLQDLIVDMDMVLSNVVQRTDQEALSRHCLRMSLLGMAIATELGLNQDNVSRVGVAGLLHDWGMLRVPRSIREAQRPLNDVEMLEIKKHPVYSVSFLDRFTHLPTLVSLTSYQVHERMDGTGYPRGRTAQNIHPFARILHVADAYIALTSRRSFRQPVMPYAALVALLQEGTSQGADPCVIRALLRVLSLFPIGSYLTLSDSRLARVLRSNGSQYTTPVVQVLRNDEGEPVAAAPEIIDLSASDVAVAKALPSPDRPELTRAPHFQPSRQRRRERALRHRSYNSR